MKPHRKLNLWDIFCISTGSMISSGLFILPAIAYQYAGPSIIIAYFLAGFLMIPSIISQSELLSAMPKSGGTYFFITRSFGPFLGIFGGLANWFSIILKSAFALIGIGTFLVYFYPNIPAYEFGLIVKALGAVFCVLFVVLNLLSVKLSARFQNTMVLFLILICLAYVFIGIKKVDLTNFSPFMPYGFKPLFSVIGMVFISYGGLTKVASIAEDTHNPSKIIPIGMLLAFFLVQVLYCLCVFVTIGVLSPLILNSTLVPLTDTAFVLGGKALAVVLSIGAMLAFITTANAGILSSSRVPLAMARDGFLPGILAKTSNKENIPYASIIATGAFMLFLILFLDIEDLVKTASTLLIILFIFVNLSVIIMRESKIVNYRPRFKSLLYPWLQIFAIIVYSFLIVTMGKVPLITSFCFVGVSVAWYFIYARKLKRRFALMHLVERVTSKEFVDNSLEEELRDILHKRDKIVKDRLDHLIELCPVLDIDHEMNRDDFFEVVSELLASRINIDSKKLKELLVKREEDSHTVIDKGLAIPHIVVEGNNLFEVIVVRAKLGIVFSSDEEPVHSIFVLAGSRDERDFHLRTLMSIANIVREPDFQTNFMKAFSKESLRMLILSSTRKRHKKVFCLDADPKNRGEK